MNYVKHVKTNLCQGERKSGNIPIVIEADGKEAEKIIDALLHRDDNAPFTESNDTHQTVTIPLESYAQMLRSHT